MNPFTDKIIVVTGAANGIGREISTQFASNQATVILADIDISKGEELEKEICSKGGKAQFISTDVSDPADIDSLFEIIHATYKRVDVLINNAGVSKWESPFNLSIDGWDRIINTNLRSVFLCSRLAAQLMKNGGAIVNISSTRALMSEPNTEAYAASKGGIIALTHALAASLSEKNIMVNCISPGWIETNFYDSLTDKDHKQHFAGRVGKPEDVAQACLFLADPANSFISGENLIIDGGMTRKMIYNE